MEELFSSKNDLLLKNGYTEGHRGSQSYTEIYLIRTLCTLCSRYRDSVALCVTKKVYYEKKDPAYCDDNGNN